MKTVITYGTFDMFHIGHLKLLKRLSEMGDRVIVAVSTDEFNQGKGKKTLIPYDQRSQIVESIKYVDMVVPEESWEQKLTDVKKYKSNVLVFGGVGKERLTFLETFGEGVNWPKPRKI